LNSDNFMQLAKKF